MIPGAPLYAHRNDPPQLYRAADRLAPLVERGLIELAEALDVIMTNAGPLDRDADVASIRVRIAWALADAAAALDRERRAAVEDIKLAIGPALADGAGGAAIRRAADKANRAASLPLDAAELAAVVAAESAWWSRSGRQRRALVRAIRSPAINRRQLLALLDEEVRT